MTTPSFFGYMLSPQLALDKTWELIETHEALIPESTFTFSFPAIDFDDDSELVLVIDIGSTVALNLQLAINGISTLLYFTDGRRIKGGVETLIDLNQTSFQISSSSILFATAFITVQIGLSKAGTNDRPMIFTTASGGNAGNEVTNGALASVTASISSLEVKTTTSTWRTGTRMSLYRVRRS